MHGVRGNYQGCRSFSPVADMLMKESDMGWDVSDGALQDSVILAHALSCTLVVILNLMVLGHVAPAAD